MRWPASGVRRRASPPGPDATMCPTTCGCARVDHPDPGERHRLRPSARGHQEVRGDLPHRRDRLRSLERLAARHAALRRWGDHGPPRAGHGVDDRTDQGEPAACRGEGAGESVLRWWPPISVQVTPQAIKPSKAKSTERIDGMVAAIMALARLTAPHEPPAREPAIIGLWRSMAAEAEAERTELQLQFPGNGSVACSSGLPSARSGSAACAPATAETTRETW